MLAARLAGVVVAIGGASLALITPASASGPRTAEASSADSVCTLLGRLVPTRVAGAWSLSASVSCTPLAAGGIADAGAATGLVTFRGTRTGNGAVALDLSFELTQGTLGVRAGGPVSTTGEMSLAATHGLIRGETGPYLSYLGVWESTISATEDPEIHEQTLGGRVEIRRARPHNRDRITGEARSPRSGPRARDSTAS